MTCDNCNKTAVVNLQKIWIKYNIDKHENYNKDEEFDSFEIEEPASKDNRHFCKKCYNEWCSGSLD